MPSGVSGTFDACHVVWREAADIFRRANGSWIEDILGQFKKGGFYIVLRFLKEA